MESENNTTSLLKQKRSEAAKKGWETRRRRKEEGDERRARVVREGHDGRAIDYSIENSTAEINPDKFLKKCKSEILRIAKETEKPLKMQIKLHCEFQFINRESDQVEKEEEKFISSFQEKINRNTDLKNIWEKMKSDILEKLYSFMEEKSGWSLKAILDLHINISKYTSQSGSSFIELPPFWKNRECVINIQNFNDNECGKWAILSALHPQKDYKKGIRITRVEKMGKRIQLDRYRISFKLRGNRNL